MQRRKLKPDFAPPHKLGTVDNLSMVPSLCWGPKGAAKEIPDKVRLSTAEIQGLLKDAQDDLRGLDLLADGETCPTTAGQDTEEEPATVDELYDLEHYDSSGEEEGAKMSGASMGNSLAGLTYYASNEEDPYITLKDLSSEDDDEEDDRILPTDNLLVVGRADEEFSSVEVHVYSESDDHAHSHHEILLTSFPLALEWMDFDPEQPDKKGNYLVVGTMCSIEVWDLDIIDSLEPVFTLGDPSPLSGRKGRGGIRDGTKGKEKKKKKKVVEEGTSGGQEEGHSDAVLGLSWNHHLRKILASASADQSVKLWDMAWPKCVLTIPHPDKVQCLQWHPYEPELLATGGYDKVVRLFNCKSPESALQKWKVKGQVEKVLWNHFQPDLLLACTDKSTVWCFQKVTGEVVYQIHAHSETISDLSLSCYVPGLLVTAGTDDTVKFWDVHDSTPVFLLSREMHMGAVFSAKFCVDSPYTLAVGGQKNGFHLLNVARLPAVSHRFSDRGLLVPTTPHGQGEESSSSTTQSKLKVSEGEEVAMETEDQTPCEEGSVQDKAAVQLKGSRDQRRGGSSGVGMKTVKTVAGRRYNRKRRKH